MDENGASFQVLCLATIGFHHLRGPEIEHLFPESMDFPKEWSILPFLSLPDGAHSSEKDFVYFTLPFPNDEGTVFGLSCTRQLSASSLKNIPSDVTRSSVQKAVVVITTSPPFGHIKDNLDIVTNAYFSQGDFSNLDVLRDFFHVLTRKEQDVHIALNINLKSFLCEWRQNALVLLKVLLLGKRILVYDKSAERLGNFQYSLLSLIPCMMSHLQDVSSPSAHSLEKSLHKPASLQTSDKRSLLAYTGFPLIIFGEGSMFSPYTPLQLVHVLEAKSSTSWLAGTTNTLIMLNQNKMAEVIVRSDTHQIEFVDPTIKNLTSLTYTDKSWMEDIISRVESSLEMELPGFEGSDDWIRNQFELYIFGMLATVKYYNFLKKQDDSILSQYHYLPSTSCISDYGETFLLEWMKTNTFRIWNNIADDDLFDVILPKHPCKEEHKVPISARIATLFSAVKITPKSRDGEDEGFKEPAV